jgi:hypothetical protein
MRRRIPGSELKIYEGAPHALLLTHMDRLNRVGRDKELTLLEWLVKQTSHLRPERQVRP